MTLYPREINKTDNFWFDFTTSSGKNYYYVNPKAATKELLFDNDEMAVQLSRFTHDVVNPAKLELSDLQFLEGSKIVCFSISLQKV